MKQYLPTLPQLTAETLSVLGASLIVAFIVYKYPPLKKFINENSIGGNAPAVDSPG